MTDDKEPNLPVPGPEGRTELLFYRSDDGQTRLQVCTDGKTVWLTQGQMADLFQTTPQNITIHLKRLYEEGELEEAATCKQYLQVHTEADRQVRRNLKYYNLDVIIAVGYRVRSQRGTQFRQWATQRLPSVQRTERPHARRQVCP